MKSTSEELAEVRRCARELWGAMGGNWFLRQMETLEAHPTTKKVLNHPVPLWVERISDRIIKIAVPTVLVVYWGLAVVLILLRLF